ncbi:DUF5684 domain-containing protein [Microbacterium sp. LRZ72]|uniref:DUF5684 domain-containing protein n=1 Tax=Microbacterium sp. LRZ72 TaxID=2942481 RepID=UPI0029A8763C|nr:DUF5684 domain-containing protein [Microbacterium sp. LRZ72]MDX2376636.1 DUF5684 domain-containing protein [Microbacterium sp. LRZ72]
MSVAEVILFPVLTVSVGAIVYVWTALALAAVLRKADRPAWQAWVPVLNLVALARLAGYSGWIVLGLLVPVVGWVVVIALVAGRIGRAFGHGGGMTALAVLVFPAWASVLGWGPSRWIGDERARADGGGAVRRGNPVPDLEGRLAPGRGAAASGHSVFGAHGVAGGPDLPPRPPAPTVAGYPSVVPRPAPPLPPQPSSESAPASTATPDTSSAAAPSRAPGSAQDVPPAPAFRSSMRREQAEAAAAVVAEETGSSFAHRAPWTQTFPVVDGVPVPPPPAAPIRAVPGMDAAADPPREELSAESSVEVSANAAAPVLGEPRAARASVSAQHRAADAADDDAFDRTIVGARRRVVWSLVPPQGEPVRLSAEVVVLGRRPIADAAFPGAQLVALDDDTRTVSKTHARLHRTDEGWSITDLGSTNGVILLAEGDDEIDVAPGVPHPVTERFLLGDAEVRITREQP